LVDLQPLLANEVFEAIKRDIVLCHLAPGEEVSEAKLAITYACGKASVRKALTRLIQEGMVTAEGRRGHVIAPLSLADIKDVFRLREQIEPFAARLAAGRIDESAMRTLDEACRSGYTLGDRDSEIGFLNANRRFHLAIAQAAGSPRLFRWMEQLHNEATRILYLSLRLGGAAVDWSHGHESLLEALVRPSPADAERIARELLEHSEEDVLSAALNSPALLNVGLM
jgi:DNA-binding GntR family transcriptional regulator